MPGFVLSIRRLVIRQRRNLLLVLPTHLRRGQLGGGHGGGFQRFNLPVLETILPDRTSGVGSLMSDNWQSARSSPGQSTVHLAGDVAGLDGGGWSGDHCGHMTRGLGSTGPVTRTVSVVKYFSWRRK